MYVESPYADLFPVFLTFFKIIYYKKYPDALFTLYILFFTQWNKISFSCEIE